MMYINFIIFSIFRGGDSLKFNYSSQYIKERITSIGDLINKYDSDSFELFLDTNICIYLREFYREPNKTIANDKLWGELKKLLKDINLYDINVDYSIGLEESSRSLSDFQIIEDKYIETLTSLQYIFQMDYFEIIEHSKIIKFSPPVKDSTKRLSTKKSGLEEQSYFQNLMLLSYACLLKLYLIYNDDSEISNLEKMKNYLDFLSNEIDIMSLSHIIYGHLLLSGHHKARTLIHPKKKTVENMIHAIWNASLDLTLPTLVSIQFNKSKKIPVFVTRDELIWMIFDSMKMKYMFYNGKTNEQPPFIEMDLSLSNWDDESIKEINIYHEKIQRSRLTKFVFETESTESRLNRLMMLSLKLEKDVKKMLTEKFIGKENT